jgi:hypothetical protein
MRRRRRREKRRRRRYLFIVNDTIEAPPDARLLLYRTRTVGLFLLL